MSVMKWTKGLKIPGKRTGNDGEQRKVDEERAFERVSNLETDSKWPGSSSAAGSPATVRKRLRKAFRENLVPCDVLDDSGGESTNDMFTRRGYSLQPRPKNVLGEGGFGKVILIGGQRRDRLTLGSDQGKADESTTYYACKIIDAREKFAKRLREFGNELNGLDAGHSHPNIIQLYDAFIIGTKFYIIMEYAEGVRPFLGTYSNL